MWNLVFLCHVDHGTAEPARFRAYSSYAESFADYAKLMKDSPRYQAAVKGVAQTRVACLLYTSRCV